MLIFLITNWIHKVKYILFSLCGDVLVYKQGWEVNAFGEYWLSIFQGASLSFINMISFTIIKVNFTQLETDLDASNFRWSGINHFLIMEIG